MEIFKSLISLRIENRTIVKCFKNTQNSVIMKTDTCFKNENQWELIELIVFQ